MTENAKYPALFTYTNALEDAIKDYGVMELGDFSFSDTKADVRVSLYMDDIVGALGEKEMLPEEVQREWKRQRRELKYS